MMAINYEQYHNNFRKEDLNIWESMSKRFRIVAMRSMGPDGGREYRESGSHDKK